MVFGGLPPQSDPLEPSSFGEWAETVEESPMPVRYELSGFDSLRGEDFGTKSEWMKIMTSYNFMLKVVLPVTIYLYYSSIVGYIYHLLHHHATLK